MPRIVARGGAVLVLATAAVLAVSTPAFAFGGDGSGWEGTVYNSGTQLDIGGTQTQPGTGGSGDGGGGGGGGGVDDIGFGPPAPPTRLTPGERGTPDCAPDALTCTPVFEDAAPPADEVDDGGDAIPAVTLADLASFVPARPALDTEPTAAGVVGMPTNFVSAATEQTVGGTLFGLPVTVRFTPVAFVFAYGDGTTGRSATGGASWQSLGQPQFTATPTSHAYGERGTYVASVSVEYAPAVDFGTGWVPVAGVVTSTTAGYEVDIYEVRTALVERTCLENPSGPGC